MGERSVRRSGEASGAGPSAWRHEQRKRAPLRAAALPYAVASFLSSCGLGVGRGIRHASGLRMLQLRSPSKAGSRDRVRIRHKLASLSTEPSLAACVKSANSLGCLSSEAICLLFVC